MASADDRSAPDDIVIQLERRSEGSLFLVGRAGEHSQMTCISYVEAERRARTAAERAAVDVWFAGNDQMCGLVAQYRRPKP